MKYSTNIVFSSFMILFLYKIIHFTLSILKTMKPEKKLESNLKKNFNKFESK